MNIQEMTDEERLKLIQIWIRSLNLCGISYTQIAKISDFTQNTITNWRKGSHIPSEQNISTFLLNTDKSLKKDSSLNQALFDTLKESGDKSGILRFILLRLSQDATASDWIQYYLKEYKNACKLDWVAGILHDTTYKEYIQTILFEKLQLKKKQYKFFEVEYWEDNPKFYENTNLDKNGWLLMRFSDSDSSYGYRILIGINDFYTKESLYNILSFMRESQNNRPSRIDMALLIAAEVIPEKDRDFFIQDNIYLEKLNITHGEKRTFCRDFIYQDNISDKDILSLNWICDFIWDKIEKYLSIIYKNVIFSNLEVRLKEGKRSDCGFLWESRFANRHEANFERERIKEILNLETAENPDPEANKKDLAIAVGFVSFPVVIMLRKYFKRIVLLENAVETMNAYREKFSQDHGIEVYVFTSYIGNYVTRAHNLYRMADLIVIGTGYASFMKQQTLYLQYINTWLKDGGIAYISYYNAEFIYDYIDRITLDDNMDFLPLGETKTAKVNINRAGKYYVYCETAVYENVKAQISKFLEPLKMYSYPMASLTFDPNKSFLQNILKEFDKEYAQQDILSVPKTFSNCRGCFLDVIARKKKGHRIMPGNPKGKILSMGYSISGWDDTAEKNGVAKNGKNFIKVLILEDAEKNKDRSETTATNSIKIYYSIALPSNKQIETIKNEVILFAKRLKFLSIAQLNDLGFETGSITPFFSCTEENIIWHKICDPALLRESSRPIFAASGSCDSVLSMTNAELKENLDAFGYDYSQEF